MSVEMSGVSGADKVKNSSDSSQIKVAREESTQAQLQSGAAPTSDTVTLSNAATQVQKLQSTIAELPVVESPRVEAIRRAIDNGSYEVDANQVATRMLNFEHALVDRS